MTTKTTETLTFRALVAVRGVCDGARSDDGRGFSGYDARFAHDILDKGERFGWTVGQFTAAKKLAHKYRKQIAANGFDPAQIVDEAIPAVRPRERVEQPDVTLWFDMVKREYDRATVFAKAKDTACVPKSLIRDMASFDGGVSVTIPHWFVAKEGLIRFAECPAKGVLHDARDRCEPHITF